MKRNHSEDFREQTRRNYDRLSGFYDLLSGGAEKRLINTMINNTQVANPATIIEIGCGTGNGLLALEKKYPSACITGVDLSFGMCSQAARKFPASSKTNCLSICQGDALTLPFPNSTFDLAFISFTFELFPDHLQDYFLDEIKRVLSPHGFVTIISMYADQQPTWISRAYAAAHTHFPKIIDCRPLDAPAIFSRRGFSVLAQTCHNIWGIPVISFTAQLQR